MIREFRHKGLRRLFETGSAAGVNPAHAERLKDILTALDQATEPRHMDNPLFHLHQLKGTRQGQWAVTVASNWRVTFSFNEQDDVIEANYEDYH